MSPEQTIIWRRLDVPGHETVTVFFDEGTWYLDGATVFRYEGKPCRLDYTVECDENWDTIAASVTGWVGEDIIEVEVEVDEDYNWTLNGDVVPELAGCVDIDLNFSPVTNLLPIKRTMLLAGDSEDVKAAWLKFPSFKLEPLEQKYTRTGDNTFKYESGSEDKFERELTVNDFGLVTSYPGYFEVEEG